VDTVLVDQHDFPRDKTCGDGLIPDAHSALERLGVLEEVLAVAQPVSHVRCVAPSGRHVDVPGRLAVLPRRELDHLLVRAAQRAGARLFTPWRFEVPLRDAAGRVMGARLKGPAQRVASAAESAAVSASDTATASDAASAQAAAPSQSSLHEITARHVVLATGAAPQATLAAGVCDRRAPSAMGLRGYVRHPGLAGRLTALEVVWHRRLKPGYGWIFPCRDGVFNIGVGIIDSHAGRAGAMRNLNLREVFNAFTQFHPAARELMQGGTLLGELRGAPLRSSLQGAAFSAPGLLVTGEAAGSTYSFTGEGIGKAMETGLLAAEALVAARDEPLDDAQVADRYRAGLAALKPKFDLYERGNRVNHHPWLTELLIRRAAASPRIRRRMADLLEERAAPSQLLTLRGLYKLVTE
jgi:flavin-dependent dehydrogenase